MTNDTLNNPRGSDRITSILRLTGWTFVAGLLITPAVAMRFTDEVQWTTSDFVFAGVILIGAGVITELAVRTSSDWSYRIGAGLAVLASVLLFWVNGAVGIIGSENEPANLLYLAVIAAAFLGAVAARNRAAWSPSCAAGARGPSGGPSRSSSPASSSARCGWPPPSSSAAPPTR